MNAVAQPNSPKKEYTYAVGKRKTSTATVRLFQKGTGEIVVNGKPLKEFVKTKYDLDTILAPLTLTDLKTSIDCTVMVQGGGTKSQAEAIRHAIARSLIEHDVMLRATLKKAGLLTRDSRMKERKKPGLKRARRAPQWSKR